jgi:hypothetical protein
MMNGRAAVILGFAWLTVSACEPLAPIGDAPTTPDAGEAGTAPSRDAGPERDDGPMAATDTGGPAADGGPVSADADVPDAAPTGPECLDGTDCDAVCTWFVDCAITHCHGYDQTAAEPLDELCRGACDVLVDVVCNHLVCGETIAYISGLDPGGAYAIACADDGPEPASP